MAQKAADGGELPCPRRIPRPGIGPGGEEGADIGRPQGGEGREVWLLP